MSSIHAMGLWLLLLVTHGVFVMFVGEAAIHLPQYLGLVIVLVILARKSWKGVGTHTLMLFVSLLIIMIVSAVIGGNLNVSIVSIMLQAKAFLLALLVAGCIRKEGDIKVMMLYCLLGLLVGAVFTIYQQLTGTYVINAYNSKRAAGLRGDPNETAMLLVAGVPLAFYWFENSKKNIVKGMSLITVALVLMGIGLTESRGGSLSVLFVGFLIYLRRPTVKMSLAAVLMLSIVLIFATDSYWERMQTLVEGEKKGGISLSGRTDMVKYGVVIFFNNILIGVGPGNFGRAFVLAESGGGSLLSNSSAMAGYPVAHNLYLEFFTENGIFAGILLLMIFYSAMKKLLVYDRVGISGANKFGLGTVTAIALAGMLFASLFLSQGKNSVLWFIVGIGLSAGHVTEEKIRKMKISSSLNNKKEVVSDA